MIFILKPRLSCGPNLSSQNEPILPSDAELVFPITKDFTIKGVVFYDGGSGWDNPYADEIPQRFLKNNSFSYRHVVGVGIRLLQPMPTKVDWGLKFDPRKGESASEVHCGMTYDW